MKREYDCQPIALYCALFLVVAGCICNWCKIIKQSKEIKKLKAELLEARQERIQIDTIDILRVYENTWGDADRQRD